MTARFSNYEQLYQNKEMEYSKYIVPLTNKVKNELGINQSL